MPKLLQKRRPQVKKGEIARSKRIGPVSGFRWLRNVEDAYRARERFLEAYQKDSNVKKKLFKSVKLSEEEQKNVRFEVSNTTPAINLFISNSPSGEHASFSFIVPGIGVVFVNIIREQKYLRSDLPLRHEEEHVKTNLARSRVKKINSVNDIRTGLITEIISVIGEHAQINVGFTDTPQHLKDSLKSNIGIYLLTFSEELFSRYPKRYNRSKILFTLEKELEEVIESISSAKNNLSAEEIISVLRQTTWDKIPQALEERRRLKQYYLAKRLRKRRPQK